jgi:hypothetical protein
VRLSGAGGRREREAVGGRRGMEEAVGAPAVLLPLELSWWSRGGKEIGIGWLGENDTWDPLLQ